MRYANANGVGDVVDIMATASDLDCRVYLPLVVARWRQPWPSSRFGITDTVSAP